MKRILVIEDDSQMLENYSRMLTRAGYECVTEQDSEAALQRLRSIAPDIILTDLRMPGKSGFDILDHAVESDPEVPVILITAYASIPTAVEAVKRGAFDFIPKPFSLEQLRIVVERAIRQRRLSEENRQLRERLKASTVDEIIGKSSAIEEVKNTIRLVAPTEANILITGESGTGKEVVAKAVHERSQRRSMPFIPVDCTAMPENLLESELFGYEKGAFTGAGSGRPGLFETASGGTIFLDEIGNIPLSMQAKLLRAIQERQVRRLGSNNLVSIDVRIISATNRDIRSMVTEGGFRDDLYYRLNVININLPPLRERTGDIAIIATYFLRRYAAANKKGVSGITPEAMKRLEGYRWPGNVRELQNVIERAVILSQGALIDLKDLPAEFHPDPSIPVTLDSPLSYREAKELWLGEFERNYLSRLLKGTSGNITRAAERGGIDRRTVYRLIKRYGLNREKSQ